MAEPTKPLEDTTPTPSPKLLKMIDRATEGIEENIEWTDEELFRKGFGSVENYIEIHNQCVAEGHPELPSSIIPELEKELRKIIEPEYTIDRKGYIIPVERTPPTE